jgi:hypothetical protein
LFGIFDPPRPETLGAVRACQQAGIVVHMCAYFIYFIQHMLTHA